MAGSFGFERDHYEVSQAVGERRLLPAVRAASPDTLIVTNGFSCREQMAQATGRHALHLAQVVAMAAHDAPAVDTGDKANLIWIFSFADVLKSKYARICLPAISGKFFV